MLTQEELDAIENSLHDFEIEEIGQLQRLCQTYFDKWFGYSPQARAKRTPEWLAKAVKRLDGQTEYCCECLEDYPASDLKVLGEIYCAKCRETKC